MDFQGVEVALSTDVLQDISATKPTKQKKENPQTVSGLWFATTSIIIIII